jgi:hypothetical protein
MYTYVSSVVTLALLINCRLSVFRLCYYGFFPESLNVLKTVQSTTLHLQDIRLKGMLMHDIPDSLIERS